MEKVVEEEEEDGNTDEVDEQPQRKEQQQQHVEEPQEAGLDLAAVPVDKPHADTDLARGTQNKKQEAPYQQQQQHVEQKQKQKHVESGDAKEETKNEVMVPQMLYCLPGGGFNDIVVQLWRCVKYAVKTDRVLILGWENYLPVLPPYEQYFDLKNIPGLKLMSQWEAASIIRAAQARGQEVTHPSKQRLSLTALLGTGEEREDGPPFFIDVASLPNYVFHPKKQYTYHVLLYHKKGNQGTPEATLKHLIFSREIKQTFLSRWSQLPKPYIGMHVRGTDRKCGNKMTLKVFEKTQTLREHLKGAPVYLATDNPEAAVEQIQELKEKQGREITSFTYFPAKKEEENRGGKKEREANVMPLHLNKVLSDEEKHQTNIDGFVDLLLLAFSEKFIMSCGGYSRLAGLLHWDKSIALSTLGLELEEGGDDDVNAVLSEAWREQQKANTKGQGTVA